MPKARDLNGKKLTRKETTYALLRRIAAYTVVLERQLQAEDFKALKTLRPFLKATDKLMAEIGYQDDEKRPPSA
jgi:hypothetical protein